MPTIPHQITFAETTEQYEKFVEKFKPKKTTDDCYTPENIYNVVLDWVANEYGIKPDRVIRPFWPGNDYAAMEYPDGCVVLDNPPFSILAEIIDFYNSYNIKYFLFAPHLTNLGSGMKCCHVIENTPITYENGAVVNTSFVTNLDDRLIVADPDLYRLISKADEENRREIKKQVPKYEYPDNVVTAAKIGWIVNKGIRFELRKEDAIFIRALDSQRANGKNIFGGGFLVSEKAAAEKAAAEKAAAKIWKLSNREMRLIEELGKNEK